MLAGTIPSICSDPQTPIAEFRERSRRKGREDRKAEGEEKRGKDKIGEFVSQVL